MSETVGYLSISLFVMAVAALLATAFTLRKRNAELASVTATKREILESLPDAYIRTDRHGTIRDITPKALEIFDRTAAEIIGQPATALYRSTEDRGRLLRMLDRAGGKLNLDGIRYKRPDGTILLLNYTLWRIADGSDCDGGIEALLRDTSEMVESLAARERSDERFRDFAEIASDWLWETDPDHNLVWVSPEFEKRSGTVESEILGFRLWDGFGESHRFEGYSDDEFRRLMDSHGPLDDIRYSRLGPNGERVSRMLRAAPRFDDDGRFLGYRGATMDLTGQIRAESNFRNLIENMPDGVYVQREGVILYANRMMPAMFGAGSKEDLVGLNSLSLYHPDEIYSITERRIELQRHGTVRIEEQVLQRLDGTHFRGAASATTIVWEGTTATMIILRDISEQVAAERDRINALVELEKSESRFRDFAQSTSDLFWETDSEFKLIWYSTPFHPVHKSSTDRFLGMRPWEVAGLPLDENPVWKLAVENHMNKRKAFRDFKMEGRRNDGTGFQVSISGMPIFGPDNEFRGYRGCTTDITTQMEMETQLRQAQKMEAIGQLTGGVAHDFNNLLSIIAGNLELIRETLPPGSDLVEFLEPASRAAQRGAGLTQHLLAFARRQPLKPVALDINNMIETMADTLERTLGTQIDVVTKFANPQTFAKADPTQTEAAILNLALNARDAMPKGGKLTIETDVDYFNPAPEDSLDQQENRKFVRLSVSDEGTGIPPDLLPNVFEPFVTTKEVGEGSGLGLSMVYGFVRQSGGHVQIFSEPDHGTTVRIFLPVADEDVETSIDDLGVVRLPSGAGEKILIVEDDRDVRSLVTILLTNLDYTVVSANDAHDALRLMDDELEPALLLTDLMLPYGKSGFDLARDVKQRWPAVPVVYMSGYSDGTIDNADLSPVDAPILKKPFKKAELAYTLNEVLRPVDQGRVRD